MENLGSGGFLAGPSGRFLDLDFSIRRQQQPELGQNSLMPSNHMINLENDQHHPMGLMMELKESNGKGFSMNLGKGKAVSPVEPSGSASEEDEPSSIGDGNGQKSKKESQWQRMKWTDDIVRLLIAVVACVGDDGSPEDATEGLKRKTSVLHKKGKWKTVSKIMISKGCHVSPQQCEDKFNDLNKRYKRLNEILGRGTSCRVVENPSLMDSMPHLSAKAKDDVRKILSSKHLFYKEMCAYHNGQRIPNCQDFDLQPLERSSKDNNGSDEEDAAGNDDSDGDEVDSDNENNGDRDEERPKESRLDNFRREMVGIFQDPTKSSFEKNQWVKKQVLQLQEQRVDLQVQSFELEKQRFKWMRYCSKKDRELQRLRLENERMRLENEESILHLKQKELEMGFRKSVTTFEPTLVASDRLQVRRI